MHMRSKFRSRRGASLVIVVVSMIAMLAIMALAIDMGMMYSARGEAQRVADAAALAGASAFLEMEPAAAVTPATRRAREYIAANSVMNVQADTLLATINVNIVDSQVEVIVRRRNLSTWFARIFGVDSVAVAARAVAEAANAGGAKCVRPWAIQDIWHELDGAGERMAQEGDAFNGDGDRYKAVPVLNRDDPTATGYGSIAHTATNRDLGHRITLKAQTPVKNPNSDSWEIAQPGPGEFLIWDLPDDPNQEVCYGEKKLLQDYPQDICSCNNNTIQIGQEYPLEFGNVVGPGFKGLDNVLASDPGAYWDPSTNSVQGSDPKYAESPRVLPIALTAPLGPPPGQNWNPSQLRTLTFTNFALFFLENYDDGKGQAQPSITGRFLYYAQGEAGPNAGSLVKYLRLVR
ncbi:MAG TPA: pilus assembly protein TadG-related protein [Longimicrobiales bacterium]|nr:pilus assembly protein TadG-related protein [Longimicrobiales bacterium]